MSPPAARPAEPGLALSWLRFHAVGLAGVAVQLAALAVLRQATPLHYLAAAALAVEAAVLHNFFWHERWTWRERERAAGWPGIGKRLAAFHLSNGLISIAGNLVLMRLLEGTLGLHYLPASAITIAILSTANFFAADRLVFRRARPRP
jgi:putative flippase GtrA